MPDDEKKEAEAVQPYTSSDVKPATEFAPDPPPRPSDETRIVSPYRSGARGMSGNFAGGVVKDFRPNVFPADAEVAETVEPESVPKDSSAQESAELSSETESRETTQTASPSPARVAASTVVKASGRRKASESSSQTSSTTPKKKDGSDSPPVETPPQTND